MSSSSSSSTTSSSSSSSSSSENEETKKPTSHPDTTPTPTPTTTTTTKSKRQFSRRNSNAHNLGAGSTLSPNQSGFFDRPQRRLSMWESSITQPHTQAHTPEREHSPGDHTANVHHHHHQQQRQHQNQDSDHHQSHHQHVSAAPAIVVPTTTTTTTTDDVPDLSAVHAELKRLSGSRFARCVEPLASRFYALAERKPTLVYAVVALLAQIVAVVPIVTYLMLFRAIFFDGRALSDAAQVLGGLVCVILGLFCFMEGLNFALMPLGEVIGHHLRHRHVAWVLLFVCLLGLLVTLCEPAVNALQTLGDSVDPEKSVHLFFLVNRWGNLLLLFVGAGVGVASSLGTMRIRRRWSLKPLIYTFVVLALALSFVGVFAIPQLKTVVEIAWDCGGITTGLVSTAIIISFGIGSGGSESDSTIEGFGIVTLASLVPIIFVLLQSFLLVALYTDEEIAAVAAAHVAEMAEPLPLEAQSPYYEMIISVRSVAPLAFFLLVTLKVLLRKPLPKTQSMLNSERRVGAMPSFLYEVDNRVPSNDIELLEARSDNESGDDAALLNDDEDGDAEEEMAAAAAAATAVVPLEDDATSSSSSSSSSVNFGAITYFVAPRVTQRPWLTMLLGMVACLLGAGIFNIGLTYGLAAMGEQAGTLLPAAFVKVPEVEGSPVYAHETGIAIVVLFSLLLGFFVTIAEPGLQVMGRKIEVVTNGNFRAMFLVTAVAMGVACGMAIGILRIILELQFLYVITGLYGLALVLTAISEEDIVNVAWDSAGVTTGVQTTPFVLALGIHLTKTTNGAGGFGVLALASVGPIISVLAFGLAVRIIKKLKLRH